MAENSNNSPPIEARSDLIEALARGSKPKDAWRIGTEHEKFVFFTKDNSQVPYEGEHGIKALLQAVQRETGWLPLMDEGNLIGLKDQELGGAISLEPGGQFELSGATLKNLHQTCMETHEHLNMLTQIAQSMGIGFLGLGVAPTWRLDEISAMPKSRYAVMAPYMEKVGTLGTSMMFRSCTVQVNLDFSSEADMVKKFRVSLALQPIATALFANSPFLEGKPSGFLSFRSQIWRHTDSDRTGMLPFVFEPGMGFERYVDYALDVPMYFITRNGKYIDCAGASFRDFMKGKLAQLPGETPTHQDWEDHISTIFPEVRLKQFLEMRGADGGAWQDICALPAFWVGLLYDQNALDAAWDLVKDWTADERETLRAGVPKLALKTEFRNTNVCELAKQVLKISAAGLNARNIVGQSGRNEGQYLAPLSQIVNDNQTRAERVLDFYENKWGGDVSRVFGEPIV